MIGLISAVLLFNNVPVFAQATTIMTDEHIVRIRSNCQGAHSILARVHANDAPTYINRNQTYFSISDKMMARLNSRLALNRYDATELVKTASEYNKVLTEFRSAYKRYDDSMAELLRMDCRKQPVSFYDKVIETREQRQKVNNAVGQLKSLIDEYRENVHAFQTLNAAQLKEETTNG